MPFEELERRLVHASGVIIPVGYLLGVVSWEEVILLCLVGTIIAFGLEFLRLIVGMEWWIYRKLTREYEQSNIAGYALYVIGATITVLVFDPRIAVPALFMLTIADPVSGLLGTNRPHEPKRPFVLGVTFALCFAFAIPFVPLVVAIAGAAAATIADGMTPVISGYVIDDNLTIPTSSAVAMWGTLILLSM